MALKHARLRAAAIHLGISLLVALAAAALVFGLWYPDPFRELSGGRELFLLVVTVDVVLGPLITLAVFNPAKSRRELTLDLGVVALLQLAALCYGLWTVAVARPVHMVFEYRRLAIAHAIEVDPAHLAKAPEALRALPWTGPGLLSLRPFRSADEEFEATMGALGGAPLPARADLWQPYDAAKPEALEAARPLAELMARKPAVADALASAARRSGTTPDTLRYLPLHGRKDVWTALIDPQTARPVAYAPVDPY